MHIGRCLNAWNKCHWASNQSSGQLHIAALVLPDAAPLLLNAPTVSGSWTSLKRVCLLTGNFYPLQAQSALLLLLPLAFPVERYW